MTDPKPDGGPGGEAGAQGRPCPECGTPRGPDNTASCSCGQRASDALRDTRTAEAAAAEDFDPLRVRPYVDLDTSPAEEAAGHPSEGTPPKGRGEQRGRPPTTRTPPNPQTDGAAPAGEVTMELRRAEGNAPLSTPPAAPVPSTADLDLFDAARPAEAGPTDAHAVPAPRRRRTVLLSVTGAAVATVTAAGFASGLFSYETPSRDGAAPEDIRASVPERTTESATTQAPPATASAPPAAASPSTSTSRSPTASPTPSVSESGTATPSATPSRSPEASRTATAADTAEEPTPAPGPVLRRGDSGPEVAELQLRLKEVRLYWGSTNGRFDRHLEDAVRTYQWTRGIRADESGVYGAATRASLESETPQP